MGVIGQVCTYFGQKYRYSATSSIEYFSFFNVKNIAVFGLTITNSKNLKAMFYVWHL